MKQILTELNGEIEGNQFILGDFNTPLTPKDRLTEQRKKQNPSICCLQETHFKPKDIHRLKVKGWKKIFHATNRKKKAGVAVLVLDKIDIKKRK